MLQTMRGRSSKYALYISKWKLWIWIEKRLEYKLKEVINVLCCSAMNICIINFPFLPFWCLKFSFKGRWGGPLPQSWLDQQLLLQKKILARMYQLGMTPGMVVMSIIHDRVIEHYIPWSSLSSNFWLMHTRCACRLENM